MTRGSKQRTWPYAVALPDNAATPGGHNVRKPDGIVVFRRSVEAWVAQDACAALNQRWDMEPDHD